MDNAGVMKTGWINVGTNRYYLDEGDKHLGRMTKGWKKVGDGWYYFNSSGFLIKGWVKSGNKFYYLREDSDGKMAINTTIKIGNESYTFDKNGVYTGGKASSSAATVPEPFTSAAQTTTAETTSGSSTAQTKADAKSNPGNVIGNQGPTNLASATSTAVDQSSTAVAQSSTAATTVAKETTKASPSKPVASSKPSNVNRDGGLQEGRTDGPR